MRILVLGASGGCGRWVTRLGREAGHDLRALVRPGTPYAPPPGVDVRVGSALDAGDVIEAMEGREAVISCIGSLRVHSWNPWSPLLPPGRVAERSSRAILQGMQSTGARRGIAISAAGVGDSFATTTGVMRWLIAHSTIGEMYADLGRMEDAFRSSDVDWLALRPVTLVDAPPSPLAKVIDRYQAWSIIGRADVAAWLLRAIQDPFPPTRTPIIGWW